MRTPRPPLMNVPSLDITCFHLANSYYQRILCNQVIGKYLSTPSTSLQKTPYIFEETCFSATVICRRYDIFVADFIVVYIRMWPSLIPVFYTVCSADRKRAVTVIGVSCDWTTHFCTQTGVGFYYLR